MPTISRLEELEIWQLARTYAKEVNTILKGSCFVGEIGLRQQMKNASGSVMDNIAEGFGRGSKNEFINHLTIAKGSLEESRSQLYRCHDCDLITQEEFKKLLEYSETLVKRITGLSNYLNQSTLKGPKFKNRQ